MNLYNLIATLKENKVLLETTISDDLNIANISYNSKTVGPETLFICKGVNFKQAYLEDAIQKGATCYLSAVKYDVECDAIIVNDIRTALGITVQSYYGNLDQQIKLVGITGTKGKTTTSMFLRSIMDDFLTSQQKKRCGVLCSVLTYDGVSEEPSRLTTKEPIELYEHLQHAVNEGLEYLSMEVSSQAIKYKRIYGLEYQVGCYLNIGEDHISEHEHPNFEDYFTSKLQLFQSCKTMCVNLDGAHIERVLQACENVENVITFSTKDNKATIYADHIEKKDNQIVFTVHTETYEESFGITLPGLFNVENALASIAICYALQVPTAHIRRGLLNAKVDGRMEIYGSKDGQVLSIVDYAHNKMSFESILQSVKKEYPTRKVYTVFGCPGDKALDRREELGTISGNFSDVIMLTEDDPGHEGAEDICKEIAQYIPETKYKIILDRSKAIERAILEEDCEKIVLVLGKGAETNQKRGSQDTPMTPDSETVKDILKKYDNCH